jgi:uncharacterized membrane protein YqjE
VSEYRTPLGTNTNSIDTSNLNGRDNGDVFGYLGRLIGDLTKDVGNLVTLHLDLLKVELKDSSKTLARDSVLAIAGAVMAMFAFGALTAALIAFISAMLPMDDAKAVAAGALIVGVLYAVIAGILVFMGINHLKKRPLAPERTMEEVQKDKQWVKEIK